MTEFKDKTTEELQELHSTMMATASDLGLQLSDDVLVEFDDQEKGAVVCQSTHDQIEKFRSGIDESRTEPEEQQKADVNDKNDVAPASAEEHSAPASTKRPSKAAPKKPPAAKVEAKPEKEKTVAKKAVAKKAAPAKKAVAKKEAPAKKEAAPRASAFDEGAKITWIGGKDGKNVAREGSGRYERVELVRKANGKTVKTFLASGGAATTLKRCVDEKWAKVG